MPTQCHGRGEAYTLEQIIDTVRVDLEELLKTRQAQSLLDCPFRLVKESILGYALRI